MSTGVPTCDTSTGNVAVPFSYAPPCVIPWKGGNNGGATAPGVSADTITIAVYQEQPDLLQETFLQQSGSDESLNAELTTDQQYVDFFESHYQTYGRKVKLVPIKASGAADDDVAAKADAIKVATEIKAFASWGGPSQTGAYADELAARGVLCLGDCILAQPESFIATRAPYLWPLLAVARAGRRTLGRVRRRRAGGQARAVRRRSRVAEAAAPVRRRALRRRRGHVPQQLHEVPSAPRHARRPPRGRGPVPARPPAKAPGGGALGHREAQGRARDDRRHRR